MDLKLSGKRALVTGGSRGLGRAIAYALLQEGVDVLIAARDSSAIDATVQSLRHSTGGKVHGAPFEARDDLSVRSLIDKVGDTFGGLDIVVNAAATPASANASAKISDLSIGGLLADFDTKLLGYLRVARAAAKGMVESGWGRIINVAGVNARFTGSFAATVRNVGITALTKSLADELSHTGVNVNGIHPGATRTERTAQRIAEYARSYSITEVEAEGSLFGKSLLGRIVEADEIAAIAAFLASPLSAAINGEVITASGGKPGSINY
jgi:NAD(P)-dependent dehydrogenase (short-subunit alcohol dehydrogenase family)